jgi:hypothetical protein
MRLHVCACVYVHVPYPLSLSLSLSLSVNLALQCVGTVLHSSTHPCNRLLPILFPDANATTLLEHFPAERRLATDENPFEVGE